MMSNLFPWADSTSRNISSARSIDVALTRLMLLRRSRDTRLGERVERKGPPRLKAFRLPKNISYQNARVAIPVYERIAGGATRFCQKDDSHLAILPGNCPHGSSRP